MTSHAVVDIDAYVAGSSSTRVAVAELAPATVGLQMAPQFILGEVPEGLNLALLAEFGMTPIRCYRCTDMGVGVDGTLFDQDCALASATLNLPEYLVSQVAAERTQRPLPVRRIAGSAAWLGGPGSRVYGHWLIDFLPRLFVLHQCGLDLRSLRFLVAAPPAPFALALLEAFGIERSQLVFYEEAAESVTVDELLVATNQRRGTRLHPLMDQSRNFLLCRAAEVNPSSLEPMEMCERLYVARPEQTDSRTIENRTEVETIMAAARYRLVRPELLPIHDQIRMFRGARAIFGQYGSGLHSCLFSPEGTATCALRGASLHPGFIQTAIAEVTRQSIGYVLSATPLEAIDQTFTVPAHQLGLAIHCVDEILRSVHK